MNGALPKAALRHVSEKKDPAQPSRASEAPLEHRRGHRHSVYRPDAAPGQTMAAPVKEGGLCSQIWNSTLKGGAAAAFWAFAARATATRCSGEWSGLLRAAPAMSLGEDNSWRSLGAAAVSACVWAFFCAVAALLVLAAARPSFGSSARRRTLNRRLAGVLLASTARLAAAGPANASVAQFSEETV